MMTTCVSLNMQQYMLGSRLEATSLISGSRLGYSGSRMFGCLLISVLGVSQNRKTYIVMVNTFVFI
jgi:hypothetical protein